MSVGIETHKNKLDHWKRIFVLNYGMFVVLRMVLVFQLASLWFQLKDIQITPSDTGLNEKLSGNLNLIQ